MIEKLSPDFVSFKLNLENHSIQDNGGLAIAKALTGLRSIDILNLKLEYNQIKPETGREIESILQRKFHSHSWIINY